MPSDTVLINMGPHGSGRNLDWQHCYFMPIGMVVEPG